MRSHTSPRWNQHWQDALFVRYNGVIGGPKELRQFQKRWRGGGRGGGCLSGVTSPVLKLWFPSFPHRRAKEVRSHSLHGRENWCHWKWGYSHFTLCSYLTSLSCRINFEIYHRRFSPTVLIIICWEQRELLSTWHSQRGIVGNCTSISFYSCLMRHQQN